MMNQGFIQHYFDIKRVLAASERSAEDHSNQMRIVGSVSQRVDAVRMKQNQANDLEQIAKWKNVLDVIWERMTLEEQREVMIRRLSEE